VGWGGPEPNVLRGAELRGRKMGIGIQMRGTYIRMNDGECHGDRRNGEPLPPPETGGKEAESR